MIRLYHFFYVYLFLKESEWGGRGRELGGQKIQSWLCTGSREPNEGPEPTYQEIMTPSLLSHPGAPTCCF